MFEYRNEETHNHYLYLKNPATLQTVEDCQQNDARLARYISDLESELETLRTLRQETFSRMQFLYSVPWVPKVELTRERRYYRDNKVFYYLTCWKIYSDSSVDPELVSRQEYPGTSRHQAIADYHAYVKSHPGILHEMHIEKGRWER